MMKVVGSMTRSCVDNLIYVVEVALALRSHLASGTNHIEGSLRHT